MSGCPPFVPPKALCCNWIHLSSTPKSAKRLHAFSGSICALQGQLCERKGPGHEAVTDLSRAGEGQLRGHAEPGPLRPWQPQSLQASEEGMGEGAGGQGAPPVARGQSGHEEATKTRRLRPSDGRRGRPRPSQLPGPQAPPRTPSSCRQTSHVLGQRACALAPSIQPHDNGPVLQPRPLASPINHVARRHLALPAA